LAKEKAGNSAGRQPRRVGDLTPLPPTYLIVCEGTKTEPNYFNAIRERIRRLYYSELKKRAAGKKPCVIGRKRERIELEIWGAGRNTMSLVKYAMERMRRAENPYYQVWVIFDKDDFSAEQFNEAIETAIGNGLYVAWSNQCFELWLLLHFEDFDRPCDREEYFTRLNAIFARHRLANGHYSKADPHLYRYMQTVGCEEEAIQRARKLLKDRRYRDKSTTPADMVPATTVHLLVEELNRYMQR
jgi:hypothetical protein